MRLTQAQAEKAVAWFRRVRGIQDWAVAVIVCDEPPEWYEDAADDDVAVCGIPQQRKQARLWVSPKRSRAGECDQLEMLFHECCHVWAADLGIEMPMDDAPRLHEYAWHTDGALLAAAYRAKVMR